ncbi:PREDICTED: apolipoprotein L2-like [Galeopterus variegatus]|uniref:Apolipoprotein L2-like n=1 Tax=Galeopterus variegatus TaxID=482537 RepID=A0ABM0S6C5_GALVR|nr:PREDICTED: apolipoprotein L2-like [Galeopterus variegatus]
MCSSQAEGTIQHQHPAEAPSKGQSQTKNDKDEIQVQTHLQTSGVVQDPSSSAHPFCDFKTAALAPESHRKKGERTRRLCLGLEVRAEGAGARVKQNLPAWTQTDSKSFIEQVIKYFKDYVRREALELLLTEGGVWESLLAEAGLSRDEANELYEALRKLMTVMATEDKAMLQKEEQDRKRFLNEFPQTKMELEELIGKLHALADKVDKVHRDCTISNVVATSTSIVSGILTILGLSLAPVTAGASLVLSATGMGLGTAAAVTGVSSNIVDYSSSLWAKAEADHLVSAGISGEELVMKVVGHAASEIKSVTEKCIPLIQRIGKHIRAIKKAKANPHLLAEAKSFMTAGTASVQCSGQVQEAFGGTALVMTKGARIAGAATAGVLLLADVISLVKESKHLHEGAKAESGKELRQRAQELEKKLEELTQIHKGLQLPPN